MTTNQSIHYIFNQIKELLDLLDNERYGTSIEILGGASIGQHVRHIYDFYDCIGKCSDSFELDYSCRDRDSDIETNIDYVQTMVEQLMHSLNVLTSNQALMVLSDFSSHRDEERVWLKSSVGRELMYGFDHAIHHLAIIKIGMKGRFPEIHLPKNLGVAPSTIKYQEEIHLQ